MFIYFIVIVILKCCKKGECLRGKSVVQIFYCFGWVTSQPQTHHTCIWIAKNLSLEACLFEDNDFVPSSNQFFYFFFLCHPCFNAFQPVHHCPNVVINSSSHYYIYTYIYTSHHLRIHFFFLLTVFVLLAFISFSPPLFHLNHFLSTPSYTFLYSFSFAASQYSFSPSLVSHHFPFTALKPLFVHFFLPSPLFYPFPLVFQLFLPYSNFSSLSLLILLTCCCSSSVDLPPNR